MRLFHVKNICYIEAGDISIYRFFYKYFKIKINCNLNIVQRLDRHNFVPSKPSKENTKNYMHLIEKGANFNLTNENDYKTEKEWHDRKTLYNTIFTIYAELLIQYTI